MWVIFSGFIGEQVRAFANVNPCQKDVCLIEESLFLNFFNAPRDLVTGWMCCAGLRGSVG